MITPPRFTERLLMSLGAEPRYREAVLGDLAEEFTIRVEEQGVGVARRWYRREALRTAPHLLANWARQLSGRDAVRLGAAVIVAGVVHRVLATAIPTAIVMALGVKPDSLSIVLAAWRDVLADTFLLKWTGITLLRVLPFGVGYLAASLNPRARIPAALSLAMLDAATMAYGYLRSSAQIPAAMQAVIGLSLAFNLAALVAGGVFRALLDRHERDAMIRAPLP